MKNTSFWQSNIKPHSIYVQQVTQTMVHISLPTWGCEKNGSRVDHAHMTIEGGSLRGEVNRGDGERGIVGDGNS